jgi:teichoic acid transport system permease protein
VTEVGLSVLLLVVTSQGRHSSENEGNPLSGAALAHEHGLKKIGGRPALSQYVTQIWERRHFAFSLARGKAYSSNQGGYLGQLWLILTPLMWAALYFMVFGMLLRVDRGIENFAAFLVTGLFLMRFMSGAMTHAATSIEKNKTLIGSLQFPRALIPISSALADLLELLPAIVVLFTVALINGEPVRFHMLLLAPTVVLASVFATGLALFSARLVSEVKDLANLMPFVNRVLFYGSGVLFSIERYGHGWFGTAMEHQPFAIYLELGRSALLEEIPVEPMKWVWGLFWAALTVSLGFIYFWRAEAKYGRG